MLNKRDILRSAIAIHKVRPKPDLNIEQYLMTPESMTQQVITLRDMFKDRKILFLGDDDHMSVIFAKHLSVAPTVVEFDPRIRTSIKKLYASWGIGNDDVREYDVRQQLPKDISTDAFYINPPFSSKNDGKGAKAWISRAVSAVPIGSTSVLVYPIDENLKWTLSCLNQIIEYAQSCGLIVTNIDKDIHTYEYLPKDPGLLSSNIYMYKFDNIAPKEIKGITGESLYR